MKKENKEKKYFFFVFIVNFRWYIWTYFIFCRSIL